MSNKITFDQKETIIEAIRSGYTKAGAAQIAGVTSRTINNEERRSLVFARRIREASEEGKGEIGDIAIERIKFLASEQNKDVRSRLTANAMLANWTVPGFRGVQETKAKVEHEISWKSAVPRPRYDVEVEAVEVKELPPGTKDAIERGIVSTNESRGQRKVVETHGLQDVG